MNDVKQFVMDTQLIFQFLILVTRSTFTITVKRLENRISEGQEGSTHNLLHCVQLLRPKLTIREVANTRFRLFKHSVFYSKRLKTLI